MLVLVALLQLSELTLIILILSYVTSITSLVRTYECGVVALLEFSDDLLTADR